MTGALAWVVTSKRILIFVTCVMRFLVLCLHFSLDSGEWRSAVHCYRVFFMLGFFLERDIFVNCNWVDTWWQWYSTHLHTNSTQNDANDTQNNTINLGKMWAVPVFSSYSLAFALQLRKKHGETSVTVAEECQLVR